MKISGKVTSCENSADDVCAITKEDLPNDVYSLLVSVYKTKIPRYQELSRIYEEELKRARNRRQKSTFPAFGDWVPTGGLLSGDHELL